MHKDRKKSTIWLISVILFSFISIIFIVWQKWIATSPDEVIQANVSTQTSQQASESTVAKPPLEVPIMLKGLKQRDQLQPFEAVEGELRLRSVGDLLIHDRVSVMADVTSDIYRDTVTKMKEEGIVIPEVALAGEETYDFMPMVARIAPYIEYADITLANLEVPVAYPQFPVSGYPQFNAPSALLTTLKAIGIDMVTNATNHTLDLLGAGAYSSIENIKASGLQYVGSYESWQDYQTPRIIEKNGIKIGFLTYSYGTNGIEIPSGEEYLISLVDLPVMLAEIEKLKPQVDAIVVTLQLGEEYDTLPNDTQREVFQALSDAGVSLILGGHPHVLQPVEWYNDKQTFAIYSQASFVSGQRELDNKQGGITEVTFKRQADGTVTVTNPKFMPIFMLGIEGEKMYETVPLADYNLYHIPSGEEWWEELYKRMHTYTSDFQYVHHLETQWTTEDSNIHP